MATPAKKVATKKVAKKVPAKKVSAADAAKKAARNERDRARRAAASTTAKAPAKKAAAKKTVINRNVAKDIPANNTLGKEGIFHVEIEMNDQFVEGNTDQLKEAILSLGVDRLNTKVVFRFSLTADAKKKNRKVVEKVLMIANARRVFNNDMSALLLEKSVKMALGYNGEETN